MCRVQEWLLNHYYSFELSPLNELYRGKLVSSIVANIPYNVFACIDTQYYIIKYIYYAGRL